VTENLAKPSPSAKDILERPPEHQILREWNLSDLQRLGLSAYANTLIPNAPGDHVAVTAATDTPDEGVRTLLPKRRL
jgi:hypothetical protein